ncbi:histone family protein [Nanoarchaeota archaeon]
MAKRTLSLAGMDKLMRQAGAPRVSDTAKEALADVLEEKGKEIALEAIKFSQHAGRKTVTKDDIKLASKK